MSCLCLLSAEVEQTARRGRRPGPEVREAFYTGKKDGLGIGFRWFRHGVPDELPAVGVVDVGSYRASRADSATLATWRRARRSDFSLAIARIPWMVTAKNRASALGSSVFDSSPRTWP